MSEAIFVREECEFRKTAAAAIVAGEVQQGPNGRAIVYTGLAAAASGDRTNWTDEGQFTLPKTTGIVITDGQEVFWDHSANSFTYAPASDRDFSVGTAVGDMASADTTGVVNLNKKPVYKIDLVKDEFLCVPVKTVVGSTTVEVPHLEQYGATVKMLLGATAEAQKLDLLSQQGFALGSNWIVEGGFNIIDDGNATAIDFNIGVANGTHASDHDAITERCGLHLNGNALDLFAMSTDGTTTVAETDTTTNIVLGTPVHFVIDGRNPADVQIYVNGVLQLPSTVFDISAAVGPLKLLAHLEKSADATVGDYRINYLRVRTMQD